MKKLLLVLALLLTGFWFFGHIASHSVVYACPNDDVCTPDPPPADPPPNNPPEASAPPGYFGTLEDILNNCRQHAGCDEATQNAIRAVAAGANLTESHSFRLLYHDDGSIIMQCINGVPFTVRNANTPTPSIPPACGVSCTTDTYCQGATDGCTACIGGVCKKPPQCNAPCNTPADCEKAVSGCVACLPQTPVASTSAATSSGTTTSKTCQPLTNICNADCTADPTICKQAGTAGCNTCLTNPVSGATNKTCQPAPACGTHCEKDASICQVAGGGCTQCVANGDNTSTCQSPIACGTSCAVNKYICKQSTDGCNACIHGKCAVSTFTPEMCSCDGMDTPPPFVSGQSITFTAYAKINGDDLDIASLQNISFQLFEGATPIASSGALSPIIISQTSSKTRYKASWTVNMPSDVKTGVTYQVIVGRACVKQPFAFNTNSAKSDKVVLGAKTVERQGLVTKIVNFLRQLFGGKPAVSNQTQQKQTNSQAPNEQVVLGATTDKSLQLGTFHLAKNIKSDNCSFVSWNF